MQTPVTWQEIREHLAKRLLLDEEWTLHREESLIWQPWLLPVHIGVYESGQYSDGYPWVAVKAWMRVADLPEDVGLACAQAGNRSCPMATFFYDDGQVVASVGVTLNGDGRSNLVWFHNAVLAMATVSHELATQVLAGLRPPDLDEAEARLGRREAPDELLGIFADDGSPKPGGEHVAEAWEQARPLLARRMAAMGFEPGYRDRSVDFYDMAGASVGVGLQASEGRYGIGLDVLAMVTPPMGPQPPYPAFVNDANTLLGNRCYCNIGNVRWSDTGQGWGALQLVCCLPGTFVAEFRLDPEVLATVVFNALMQVAQSARTIAAAGVEA